MSTLLDIIKNYFENTPTDILKNDFNNREHLNDIGPDVIEYATSIREFLNNETIIAESGNVSVHELEISNYHTTEEIDTDSLYYLAA